MIEGRDLQEGKDIKLEARGEKMRRGNNQHSIFTPINLSKNRFNKYHKSSYIQ